MKISDFLSELQYNTIDDDIKAIEKSHPLQWIDKEVKIPIWKVEYKYMTNNKEKTHIKYIIKEECMNPNELENYFKYYVEEYNNKHPYRALSNVEILDMQFIDGIILELE